MNAESAPSAPLFREEAMDALRAGEVGRVVLTPRISSLWVSLLAAAIALALVAFLIFGSYTRRVAVTGQLVPAAGVIRVHTPQQGIVLEKRVGDGQLVQRGDVLYVLTSDRLGMGAREVQADIARAIGARKLSLQDELRRLRQVQADELDALRRKERNLRAELATIAAQSGEQRERVRMAEDAVQRYQGLADKDYISRDELESKRVDLNEQRSHQRSLRRDALAVQRELTQVRQDLESAPGRNANQLAQIERDIASTEEQLTEAEARRRVIVTAPESGRATLVHTEVGQMADPTQALLTLVPAHGPLRARLYAPSSSIGFVQPGDQVLLRYQAFPYQKFGQYRGTVESVSRSVVGPAELAELPTAGPQPSEPMFAIQVDLQSSAVVADGQERPLQAGMLVDADILQERRKLYEWMLEPLFSISGGVAS